MANKKRALAAGGGGDVKDATPPVSLNAKHATEFTDASLLDTIAAGIVGNLFGNSLCVLAIVLATSRYLGVTPYVLAVFGAYWGHAVFVSKAHIVGAPRAWFQNSALYRHLSSYFGFSLVGDAPLQPGQKYIFCVAPHGIHGLGTGAFMHHGSCFYERYPFLRGRMVGLVATVLFKIPGVREVFLWSGCRDASRHVAERALREDNSLFIIIGGEAESLLSRRGHDEIVAAGKGRQGFVRLALANGAQLVPFYMYHNVDTYYTSHAFWRLRKWLSKRWQVCLPLFAGRWGTPTPINVRMTLAVGNPVPLPAVIPLDARGVPTPEVVEAYQAAFLAELRRTFEAHKAAAGYHPARMLKIVEAA
jgi:hypothetical protein